MEWKKVSLESAQVSLLNRWPMRLLGVLALLFALVLNLALPLQTEAAPASGLGQLDDDAFKPGSFQPGLVAVKFRPNLNANSATPGYNYNELRPERYFSLAQFREFGLTNYMSDRVLPGLFYYQVSTQADMKALVTLLRADPQVQYAEPNYIQQIQRSPNDTFYQKGRQYYLSKINAEGAWDVTTGANVVVAIVDTGVRIDHPDIQRNIIRDRAKTFLFDVVNGDFLETLSTGATLSQWDPNGHGTAVAGIIGANTNNDARDGSNSGIAGVSWAALLLPVQVCDATGSCPTTGVASGITYAADNKARIINLSLGGQRRSDVEAEAIRYAQNKGVIVVASAGNESLGSPSYPASYAGVIGVGASDENDRAVSFSNYGPEISVVAPGVHIWTTYCNFLSSTTSCNPATDTITCNPNNTNPDDPDACFFNGSAAYVYLNGTSFAAPIVTGVIALMISVRPDLSASLAQSILQQTADRPAGMTGTGRDPRYGFGRVNAARAVAQAKGDVYASQKTLLQGFVQGAILADVVMSLDLGDRGTTITKPLDTSNGSYRFENLGAATYNLRALIPKQNRVLGPVLINATGASGEVISVNFDFGANVVIAGPGAVAPGQGPAPQPAPNPTQPPPLPTPLLSPNAVYFQRLEPRPSLPDRYYFSEVGHTLGGAFKRYWDRNGGLAIFGFPISEEFQETSPTDGKTYTVQYFERNRFEYHAEFAGSNNEVLLGLLGSELTRGRNFPTAQPIANSASARYFPETRHTLTDRFYNYWRNNGGLAIFGYPISEPMQEGNYQVQYFERNRFEYHPENAGNKYEVLLGLLGTDLARSLNYLPPAEPRPNVVLPEGWKQQD